MARHDTPTTNHRYIRLRHRPRLTSERGEEAKRRLKNVRARSSHQTNRTHPPVCTPGLPAAATHSHRRWYYLITLTPPLPRDYSPPLPNTKNLNKHLPKNALYHCCTRERCLDLFYASDRFECTRFSPQPAFQPSACSLTSSEVEGPVITWWRFEVDSSARRQRPLCPVISQTRLRCLTSLYNLSTPSFLNCFAPRPEPSLPCQLLGPTRPCSGEHRWTAA